MPSTSGMGCSHSLPISFLEDDSELIDHAKEQRFKLDTANKEKSSRISELEATPEVREYKNLTQTFSWSGMQYGMSAAFNIPCVT